VILFFSHFLYTQEQVNIWYFGFGEGLDFDTNATPVILSDGQISNREGCAGICDNDGNLLFYMDDSTDSLPVYVPEN
jgi:hypothetical protein